MKVTSQIRSATCVTPTFWPGEDVAEIHFLAVEADPATPGDGDRVVVKGVGELLQSLVDARRSRVDVGGNFHP